MVPQSSLYACRFLLPFPRPWYSCLCRLSGNDGIFPRGLPLEQFLHSVRRVSPSYAFSVSGEHPGHPGGLCHRGAPRVVSPVPVPAKPTTRGVPCFSKDLDIRFSKQTDSWWHTGTQTSSSYKYKNKTEWKRNRSYLWKQRIKASFILLFGGFR